MQIAVLSDIHANLEALERVVEDIENRGVEKTICLGDMVGYGPDPDGVVDLVRQKKFQCLMGNHEAGFVGTKYRKWLNFQARENNQQTEDLLSEENREFCRNLPFSISSHGAVFVHGFPPDSPLIYLKDCTDKKVLELFSRVEHSLFFVGHTHTLNLVYVDEREQVVRQKISCGEIHLEKERKYLINAGSVGQPRDGENSAKYLIFDPDTLKLEVVCLQYDREETIKRIEKRGFPAVYGSRLR